MSRPIEESQLKIVWAQEHLDFLKLEIDRYKNDEPHKIKTYEGSNGPAFGPTIAFQPDINLGLIVGDCLTNARAALDYIMFALCLRYFQGFDPENVRAHRMVSSFLLVDPDPDKPDVQRLTHLKDRMPDAVINGTHVVDVIESVQPYHGGYRPLWWLSQLVNIDKHRLLLITKSNVVSATIAVSFYGAPDSFMVMRHTTGIDETDIRNRLRSLGHDAEGFTPEKVKVESQPTIHVTFKDLPVPLAAIKDIPIDSVLQQIIETVVEVLPKFDPFLS